VEVTAAAWVATIAVIVVLLGVDLAIGALRPHAVGFAEAAAWSVFYIAVALAFGVVIGLVAGWEVGGQYFAGYLVEKSLSVDNLFVFVVIMTTFAVPQQHQQKVLTFGIVLALVMRAIFIAVGAALLELFSFMFLVFGLLLIGTAVQLYRHRDEDPEVDDNVLVRLTRRVLPTTTEYQEGRLVTRVDGRRAVTPLFIVNAFALLGLRALFFDPAARAHAGSLRAHATRSEAETTSGS
jgi:tellurite resistance protein TerC